MSEPADLPVEPRRTRGGGAVSLIWLVPLLALAIAFYIAWQSYSSRGSLVEIVFDSAEGVVANSTVLKYRDVNVGVVESIEFTSDLRAVVLSVRVDNQIAPFIDSDAEFWIVRPQVTARGVTGLNTVLSGVYLEGDWDGDLASPQTRFEGLPRPPLVRYGNEGLELTLRAGQGGRLHAGAPIVYRGVDVGYIDTPVLSDDGESVTARAFIEAPHDDLVTTSTRFWTASGFAVQLGAGGLSLDVPSLAALLEGGITFDNVAPARQPVSQHTVFEVFDDEEMARANAQALNTEDGVAFSAFFEGSVSGLTAGAPVEFEGLEVGTVTGLGVDIDGIDSAAVELRVDLSLSPERLGLEDEDAEALTRQFITDAVSRGLRARLASDGLFSQSLKIELLVVPGAEEAVLDTETGPAPVIPTTDPEISDVAESARGVLNRIQNLPIEALFQNASDLLASLDRVVASEDAQQAPEAVVGLIQEMRNLIGSEEVRSTIASASDSAAELNQILTRVNESPALPALLAALSRTEQIAASIQSATETLPELLESARHVVDEAAELPLDQLASSASNVVAEAERLIASEQVAALPQQLSDALANLQGASEDLRSVTQEIAASGAVQTLLDALQRTSSIAASVEQTAAGLPELVAKIDAFALTAQSLPLSELTENANGILTDAQAILSSQAAADLPVTLDTALTELTAAAENVTAITGRLTEGPALDNLAAALERTDSIAANLDDAAAGLPELLDNIGSVAAKADTLPLEQLVTSADELVRSANALVGSEDAAQIPAALTEALNQLSATLDEFREAGAVESINQTLASASVAADAIAEAAEGLPALTGRLDQLILSSESVLETYGDRSDFNIQSLSALRDLRDAARAVTSLARTIERKPNSLIIGR